MFRKHIELIESFTDTLLTNQISDLVAAGNHEGYNPYWKLVADERVLSDEDAMTHIAGMISDGFTSGMHPHWELKVVESKTEEMPHEDELEEDVLDVVHAHMVVPVAETHGVGQGWYEVTPKQATMWVVEDETGNAVDSYPDKAMAVQMCSDLNAGLEPHNMTAYRGPVNEPVHDRELELVEDDEDLTDEASDESSRFDDSEDFVVIINAIHERGPRQIEALRELSKRGLWLSPEQKEQAGLDDPEHWYNQPPV